MTVMAVVFDVGKVLFEWAPHYLYDKLIPDADARAAFLEGFRASPSAVSQLLGNGPDIVQEWELIGLVVGGLWVYAATRVPERAAGAARALHLAGLGLLALGGVAFLVMARVAQGVLELLVDEVLVRSGAVLDQGDLLRLGPARGQDVHGTVQLRQPAQPGPRRQL